MKLNEAKGILTYIKSKLEDKDKLNKGLREVKLKITKDKKNCHIFRKLGLTSILIELLKNPDERVLKWVLSILTSCLMFTEYQKEVHETGLPHLFDTFIRAQSKTIQHRVCRVIGQQCLYVPSCSTFHSFNVTEVVLSFIKDSESDEERESAIKTLRSLANTPKHQNLILKEEGIYYICELGLSLSYTSLTIETLRAIQHFNKWPSSVQLNQLIKGSDNFLILTKIYELNDEAAKKQVLEIFLTIFSNYSSCSNIYEYRKKCEILDYLCMAKLPLMIMNELKTIQDSTPDKDDTRLILTLCKFCELNNQWQTYSYNVLPMYHERTWMQVIDYNGIPLLVSLLSSKRQNLSVLQSLFKGLLGVEHIHSNRVRVLTYLLRAKLLPLLAQIFDDALKETCCYGDMPLTTESCHHFSTEKETDKRKTFSKEASKEILDFIKSTSPKLEMDVSKAAGGSSDCKAPPPPPPPSSTPTTNFKQINKIKFRTGKRTLDANGKRRRQTQSLDKTSSPASEVCASLQSAAGEVKLKGEEDAGRKSASKLDKHTQMWMNVLEYIVRLLFQVISIKEDITSICREFLLKFYHYLSKAYIVHPSALKLLSAIAKNSSSIQYALDILFIPKLAVDLVQESLLESCSQCALINEGVSAFLVKLRLYFNHYHQYGRCEVANRLNPSKPLHVKHSCLVAITHVVKCPKLLHSFLLDHRGLDSLFDLFRQTENEHPRLHLYGLASLCTIGYNLKVEYCSKYANNCLFCESGHLSLSAYFDKEKKEKKKQLLILTSSHLELKKKCVWKLEKEKDCSFKLEDRTIAANRKKLSTKNEVLKVMLEGSFSESTENCFQMKDMNPAAIEMLIHFIYGCTCDVFTCNDSLVYSELLFVAQMYFIPELKLLAVHFLAQLLKPDQVYQFVESRLGILEKDILQHLFCALISQPTTVHSKIKWMEQFLRSSLKDVFSDNILSGLTRLLELTSNLCNCEAYRTYM